ncbi:MAG: alanyl-tRNA editing protein, partial [Clostridiales bacterium]|nr:alanyl-tRNA editing protein [Candidatus Blautia equi]
SGLIHEKYGYENVGFHLGSDVITIDLSGPMTAEQVAEIERKVNLKIWENQEVIIQYPSPEELKTIPYRSKKELTGKVRIVTFPGADICACCGTHVARTGEIGMVKLLSVVKFHEGVRIEMICGGRVLAYLNQVDAQNHAISVRLSAKPDKTAEAVTRLYEENARLKVSVSRMEEESFAREAAGHKDAGNCLIFKAGLEADSVRKLADAVMQSCGGRCALFSDNGDGTYKYAIGEQNGDLRALNKEMNAALNGRGGGKPFFVQGSVCASESEIRSFFAGK